MSDNDKPNDSGAVPSAHPLSKVPTNLSDATKNFAPSDTSSEPTAIGSGTLSLDKGLGGPPVRVTVDNANGSVGGNPAFRLAEIDNMGSAKDPPVPGMKITRIAKPHSRTAVGRLTQSIKTLPVLHVFELVLHTDTDSKLVGSHKLRHKAVNKWISSHFTNLKDSISNHTTRDEGIVRLIVLVRDESEKIALRGKLNILTGPKLEVEHQGTTKNVRWQVQTPQAFTKDDYKKTLDSLLRKAAGQLESFVSLPITPDSSNIFDPLLLGCPRSISSHQPSDYKLYVRNQPSVNVPDQQLIMDFDVIPCIPSKPLDEVVLDLVGHTGTEVTDGKFIREWLPKIKHSLRGVQVRCRYIPGAKTPNGRGASRILTKDEISEGRRFQIRDIRMPSEDPGFDVDGVHYNTYDYFSKVVVPGSVMLDTKLPLVQDMSEAWIPIQMLFVDGPQLLIRYGHLDKAIHDKIRSFLKQDGMNKIFRSAAHIVREFPASRCALCNPQRTLETNGSAAFAPDPMLTSDGATDPVVLHDGRYFSRERTGQVVTHDAKISIIYVQSQGEIPPDTALINKVRHGLRSVSSSVSEEVFNRKPNSMTLITNMNELKMGFELLFAIIEDSYQEKRITKKIISRLHQYADRQAGVLLVCATRSHLERLFKGSLDVSDMYFPASLRAKINYKLGGTNYETRLQPLAKDARLMIAGAHTAHQYGAEIYCPSVSAIVASKDIAGEQYLGSVRIHVTTLSNRVLEDGATKREIIPGLHGIQDMMVERFKAWSTPQAPPTQLLFFCDSIDFDNVKNEDACRHIRLAYETVFSDTTAKLLITYVVVNKNTKISYESTKEPNDKKMAPLFDFVVRNSSSAKCRYYVVKNEVGWKEHELAAITQRINQSSQIATQNEQLSRALPTLLASKLCKRTYDYFRDIPEVKIPRESMPTDDDATTEATLEFDAVCKVKEYLDVLDEGVPGQRLMPWKPSLDNSMFYL